jgi:four helix bundle protein
MKKQSPERQRTLQLQERVFTFACTVLTTCARSIPDLASREIWGQLVRAAPSASNNLEKADEASSTADFIATMKIALREAKESRRCLKFLLRCKLAHYERLGNLEDEARQISSIFATIIINTKERVKREKAERARRQKAAREAKSTQRQTLSTP